MGVGGRFIQADGIEHCFSSGTSIENAMMSLKTLIPQLFCVAQFISCFKGVMHHCNHGQPLKISSTLAFKGASFL